MPAKARKAKSVRKAKPAKRASKPAAAVKAAKPARQAKPAKEAAPAVRRSAAELHFTETTIIRGDAVEHGKELPSGATHEIAGHDECGRPVLKRKRFSIY